MSRVEGASLISFSHCHWVKTPQAVRLPDSVLKSTGLGTEENVLSLLCNATVLEYQTSSNKLELENPHFFIFFSVPVSRALSFFPPPPPYLYFCGWPYLFTMLPVVISANGRPFFFLENCLEHLSQCWFLSWHSKGKLILPRPPLLQRYFFNLHSFFLKFF